MTTHPASLQRGLHYDSPARQRRPLHRLYSTELANLLNEHTLGEPDGGFTVTFPGYDLSKPRRYVPGGRGAYVVAISGHEYKVPASVFFSKFSDDESRCIVFRTWLDRTGWRLTDGVGAWHDPDTGDITFDLVRFFPDTEDGLGHDSAEAFAKLHQQKAYAELDEAGELADVWTLPAR